MTFFQMMISISTTHLYSNNVAVINKVAGNLFYLFAKLNFNGICHMESVSLDPD